MTGNQCGLGQIAQMFEGSGCFDLGALRVLSVPGMGDDDVVEGRMALAETRETDFKNHGSMVLMWCFWSYYGDYLSPLQKMMAFAIERTSAKNSLSPVVVAIDFPFTLASHSFHCHSAFHSHLWPFTSSFSIT